MLSLYFGFGIDPSVQPVCAVSFSLRYKIPLACLALAVAACAGVAAQPQARPNVIVDTVEARRPALLANHHPLWANAANDQGALAPQEQPGQMTLVLARSAAQQAALEQLLADQQNPASPLYHHWLTPQEMGDRFGISESDLKTLSGWLEGNGLQVDWVAPSRVFIAFHGTAAAVGNAFQSELHTYRVNGEHRLGLNSEARIPAALAPAIHAVRGLFTLQSHPNLIAHVESSPSPLMTNSSGSHFVSPADFATIYSTPDPHAGSGQTIGIVGRSRTNMDDFANFKGLAYDSFFPNPIEVVPTALGGVDPGPAYTAPPGGTVWIGDQSEATLDVERAGSTASGANLLLVVSAGSSTADGIDLGAQYLVQTSPVPAQIMNISYGECESAAGASGITFWDTLFQQAAGEGISVFVSSGDAGASGCDNAFAAPLAYPAANSANYLCASSYATCVGGTEFNDNGNPSLYWRSTDSSVLGSAQSYIPEGAWNEPLDSNSNSVVAATGGGVSAYVATPSWQTGTGVPAPRTGRYTPDVSFNAAYHDGYFGCMAAGGGSCVLDSYRGYSFMIFSGTSAAAPAMAGVAAMLNQRLNQAQGNLNPNLYQTAAQSPTAFNDVTVASSGVTNCSVNTPSMCNNSIPGANSQSGGQAGYLVGTGYDEATGLGSLNIQNFLTENVGKTLPTFTLSVQGSIPASQSLKVQVWPNTGVYSNIVPTGSIVLSGGGYTSPAVPLQNGVAAITIPAFALAVGTQTLTATYTPDAASSPKFTSATATNTITVTLPEPTVSVTLSADSITVLQPLTVNVTVAAAGGNPVPTGTIRVAWYPYASPEVPLVNGSAVVTIPAESLSGRTGGIGVSYTPDTQSSTVYAASYGYGYLTVSTLTPTVTVTPSSNTVATTDPLTVTVTVDGGSGNPTPGGQIALTGNGYNGGATLTNGSASFTIPGGTLPAGVDTLQAVYNADLQGPSPGVYIYSQVFASATVGVTVGSKLPPTIRISMGANFNLQATQPIPLTVSVSGLTSMPIPTGTVVFSSGSYTSDAVPLNNGAAAINIPARSLSVGNPTITATYAPDTSGSSSYMSANKSIGVYINGLYTNTALSASANTISTARDLTLTATVSDPSGSATPTGNVTLSNQSGSSSAYTATLPLNNGSAVFTIPAGSLNTGAYMWLAQYVPDANSATLYYQSSSNYTTVYVTVPFPGISIAGTTVTIQRGAATGNASTITVTPSDGFTGNVALTAVLTNVPSSYNTTYLPTFSFGGTSPCVVSGTSACTATMAVTTTAATTGALSYPRLPWYAPGGPALAGVLLVLLRKQRRRWLSLFALFAVMTFVTGISSCGGGGGASGGGGGGGTDGGGGIAGTTPGNYTVTVTGTSGNISSQSTVNFVVQ